MKAESESERRSEKRMALAMPEVVVESAVCSPLARPLHSSPLPVPAAHCVRAHLLGLGPRALAAHLPRARLFLRYYYRTAHSGQAARPCMHGSSGQKSALRVHAEPAAEQGECRPAACHWRARGAQQKDRRPATALAHRSGPGITIGRQEHGAPVRRLPCRADDRH